METTQGKSIPVKKKKRKPMKMMDVVLYMLLFVFLWGTANQWFYFGHEVGIQAILKLIVACGTAWLTHAVFYAVIDWQEKKEFSSFFQRLTINKKKISRNVPYITAVILAIRFRSGTPLYLIVLSVILAELVGKLIWGGFGKNKVNPVAVGFLLTDLMLERYNVMPMVDGVTAATPLSMIATDGWYFGTAVQSYFYENFGSLWQLLVGTVPAPSAEMSRLVILIAFGFMVYQKTIDWFVPTFVVGTVFIGSTVIALFHGFDLTYPFYHILTGGLFFGAVFMATDPVTMPKNKMGKMIFAILLGTLTLAIRIGSLRFPEGFLLSLVVMNLLAPWINEKAAPLNKKPQKVQVKRLSTIFVAGLVLVLFLSIVNTGI